MAVFNRGGDGDGDRGGDGNDGGLIVDGSRDHVCENQGCWYRRLMLVAAFTNNGNGAMVVTGRLWFIVNGGSAHVFGDHRDVGVADASDGVDDVMGLVNGSSLCRCEVPE